ncbi:V-set and immunoglobulin domain-containing 1 [Paramuricea clavata]|uniref:V-set and immunoglobulin domain-containing 1 n=1 Tax=Paramuricea clavata TaxID=317549 RepID=A0A7D9DX52_PARCT|nr:V-set and immunoglobulin domain-containing 1 [Paramuricea clavata]
MGKSKASNMSMLRLRGIRRVVSVAKKLPIKEGIPRVAAAVKKSPTKEGKSYMKAKIQKNPNEAYYDIGINANLTCEAEQNTNLYEIIWYKFDSRGYPIKLKSALDGPGILTLTLNSLSAKDSGSYKCEVFRPQVNYYNSQFVNITVKVKPEIQLAATYLFKKGMIINCSLKNTDEVNPPQVKYTWFSCDSASCDEESAKLKIESYSLRLNSQARIAMKYRCIAINAAGSDSKIIEVIKLSKSTTF